ARGVAALRVLCEYCLPFVRVGGVLLAMKGPSAAIEARDARRAVAMLGAKVEKIVPTPLHGAEKTIDHTLVVIKKIAPTPAAYPRDNSQITRHPL
ncbi:MAG: class I SAM-dependent methyltransferase, partial [Clostridia bacterium]|nr:class I SAM-dependent methyltransferase [Clostridia bacterium]